MASVLMPTPRPFEHEPILISGEPVGTSTGQVLLLKLMIPHAERSQREVFM